MPIRINLLAEAQAAEELRRKDPVKLAFYVAGFVVFLIALWAMTLQFKIMAAGSDLSGLGSKWKSIEPRYNEVVQRKRQAIEMEEKLAALGRMTTNRFLWANALNAFQQSLNGLLETGMGTTNGLEVSPDEWTLYVNETVQRNIWAYDLSPRGEISNKRLLIQFPDFGMDGMRCDMAGNLYVTRWGKGVIAKVSPQGEVLMEIGLAGAKCTNIAFGGPDGCTAYVTGADRGNVETFRVDQPGREWQLAQRV